MTLDIIKYNYNKTVRIVLFTICAVTFILSIIKIKFVYDSNIFRWILLLLIIIFELHRFFIKRYNIIGSILFDLDKILILKNNLKMPFQHSEIKNIKLYYKEYRNDIYEEELFYKGYWSRDGSNNYICINDNKYQVLIKNKKEVELINIYFNNLNNKDIDAKFIKSNDIKRLERVLLVIYFFLMLGIFTNMSKGWLFFMFITVILELFYLLGSWYFLGLSFNKIKTVIIAILIGCFYSIAITAIQFNIMHWRGERNLFLMSEIGLIFTFLIIYLLKITITKNIKNLLYYRTIALFVLNIIMRFL